MKTLYVTYHQHCGHVLGVSAERSHCEAALTALTTHGRWGWRIRAGGSDPDLKALLAGERCASCSLDGVLVPGVPA
jgi:hypothetical protein